MTPKSHPIIIISLVLTGLFTIASIQTLHSQGKNEEVTIIAPYIPSIQNASKFPFRPEISPGEQPQQEFEFEYLTKNIEVTTELDPIDPIKFSGQKTEDIYNNYIKGGFGNYLTPYLDFLASTAPSEKYLAGARVSHLSSQGGIKGYADNAYSHNLISANGSAFLKPGTLSGTIGYKRDVVHYYGVPLDSFPELEISDEEIRQRYQHFFFTAGFEGRNKSRERLSYKAGTEFHFYNDRYDTREIQFGLDAGIDKVFSVDEDFHHGLAFDFRMDYLGYKDTTFSKSPLIMEFRPMYRFGLGVYDFQVGLSMFVNSDNSSSQSSLSVDVFPHLRADVVLIDDQLKAFAEVTGMRKINTFRSLTGINPFLTSTPLLIDTDEQIKIAGGLEGNAGGLNFTAEASYAYNNDMVLFVNDTSLLLQNKFIALYDDVNVLNIKASIGYLKVRNLEARLLASFYKYIPKNEEKAWHLPSFEVGLYAGYVIREKFTIRGDFMILGKRYARTFEDTTIIPVKLKSGLDLNLGFEYRITKQLSAFANVNNVLNQDYQRWYNYPVQGIQGMLGVTFSF